MSLGFNSFNYVSHRMQLFDLLFIWHLKNISKEEIIFVYVFLVMGTVFYNKYTTCNCAVTFHRFDLCHFSAVEEQKGLTLVPWDINYLVVLGPYERKRNEKKEKYWPMPCRICQLLLHLILSSFIHQCDEKLLY